MPKIIKGNASKIDDNDTTTGATTHPTRAHVEHAPIARLRTTVGNSSAAYTYIIAKLAVIPNLLTVAAVFTVGPCDSSIQRAQETPDNNNAPDNVTLRPILSTK